MHALQSAGLSLFTAASMAIGLVAEMISWRVGFFINLPIGMALILGARRCLVETPLKSGRLDGAAAVSSTLGMGALVFGIVRF